MELNNNKEEMAEVDIKLANDVRAAQPVLRSDGALTVLFTVVGCFDTGQIRVSHDAERHCVTIQGHDWFADIYNQKHGNNEGQN